MKKITVVTHAGKFHADDVFGVAALSLLFEKKKWQMKLIRTLDPVWIKKADFVLDIGRVYNAKKNRFDHHQAETAGKRKDGILYASFGLIWKKYGTALSGSKMTAAIVDRKLVAPLDAADTGISTYKILIEGIRPVTIESYVDIEAVLILDLEAEKGKEEAHRLLDMKFRELVDIARKIIEANIIKARDEIKARKAALQVYKKSKNKKLIILDKYIGFNFGEFPEPLIIIYPDMRGRWSAKMVKIENEGYKSRIYFPKIWRGKVNKELAKVSGVKDAQFCHNSGFLAVADSKEGAIALAKLGIKAKTKS